MSQYMQVFHFTEHSVMSVTISTVNTFGFWRSSTKIIHTSYFSLFKMFSVTKNHKKLTRFYCYLTMKRIEEVAFILYVWWHFSAITCQMIMLTCQLFISTCQIIMSNCQKKIITTSSLLSSFYGLLTLFAAIYQSIYI